MSEISGKKRKTQTPSQEIASELETTVISSPPQKSKTSKQTSPPSLPTARIQRISRQTSPRFSSRTSPPSFSSTITTSRTQRTSPPSFFSSRTQRSSPPQLIEISLSPPSPVNEPYVYIPYRPLITSTDRPLTTSTDRPLKTSTDRPLTTSTDRSIARFTISTRGRQIESTPRRTYGRFKGRGRGKGKGLSRKYKGKGKEVIRDDYGSPQEGWIDIGSGIKKSVTLESQIKYTIENNHVYIKFYFKYIYIYF